MGRIGAKFWAACLLLAALLSCTPEGERYLCNYRVAEISTTDSTVLAGFAARNGLSDGVHRDLMSHCLVLQKNGEKICIISNDLMEVGIETADEIRKAISEQSGLPMDHILMHCIHTHSAPRTGGWCAKEGQPNYAYAQKVRRVVVENAVAAIADDAAFRPFEMEFGQGTSDINYNRCDKDGFCNKDAYVLRLVDPKSRKPIVSMVNYSCHPVSLGPGSYKVSTDFPGFSCDSLSKAWGGEVVHFTSASGNADPAYGIKKDVEAAERNGWQLATDLKDISFRKIPFDGSFTLKTSRIDLPYRADTITVDLIRQHVAEVTQWKNTVSASWVDDVNYWAKYTIEDIEAGLVENTLPFYVEAVNLGGVVLFFTQGEPFMEYQVALRERFPDTPLLFIAYTNGQNSYLPSKTAFEDTSGKYDYEVKQMHVYIGAPYPLSERMPDVYLDGITDIVREVLQPEESGLTSSIIPKPLRFEGASGCFTFGKGGAVAVEATDPLFREVAGDFAATLRLPVAQAGNVIIRQVDGLATEAYRLTVSPEAVTIEASAPNGAFYGTRSLLQLLPPQAMQRGAAGCTVPCCRIDDAPAMEYRAIMADVARHFQSREEIEKVIDILALHKINTFHWHLTDDQGWRIESKKYPDLVKAGPYYTQEDLRAVVEYARRRYVTVVPEVELPGHALAALSAYPVFSYHPDSTIAIATDLGIYDEIFCPSDTTYTFFTDIFGELFDIFPSKYYHIGGDECPPDDGSQAAFIVRITEFLQAHGKEVIAWDEVVDRGATPGTIALSYRGHAPGKRALDKGMRTVFTPNRWCYLDYYQEEGDGYPSQPYFLPLSKVYNYYPISDTVAASVRPRILGVEGCLWTEFVETPEHFEHMLFPRALALAETGWTPKYDRNYADFCRRLLTDLPRLDDAGVHYSRAFGNVLFMHDDFEEDRYDNDRLNLQFDYPDGEIRYTTDGSVPTRSSFLYTGPAGRIAPGTTVKAQGFDRRTGKKVGRLAEKTFGIAGLLPQPEKVEVRKGTFRLRPSTTVTVEDGDSSFVSLVNYLTGRVDLRVAETAPEKNYLKIRKGRNNIPREGYVMEVAPEGITIWCSAPNGAFYALQTLFQLMPDAVFAGRFSGKADIPCCRIEDAPRFEYRGMHLDVCSHFFGVDFIKKYLDELAMHKFNVFHWHLTEDQGWRIEIRKYPKLTEKGSVRPYTVVGDLHSPINDGTPHGGFYTQDEIREIVRYAAERYITVLPEIEMPGHARAAITCFPELSCFPEQEHSLATKWGVFRDVYCPREETFAFLEDVLTEVMELFPSPLIHIGGDECPKYNWEHSEFCQQLMRREGLKNEEELQSWFIRRIERFLNGKGRNIIGWDEILQGGLAPNAAVMSWLGEQGGIAAARQHHKVVMCPYQRYYLDYYQVDPTEDAISMGHLVPLKVVYDYEPVPAVLTEEEKEYIIGVEGTVWTEYIKNPARAEYMAFPRALAIAEAGWTRGHAKDFDGFTQRMERHFARLDAAGVNYCRNWNVTAYQDETYGTAF
ncbi:MAG: family 20 glycosylhydrolase [Bacteroidales bacterium]|nr:family 20 glycosylhydrolase [Bacteroidales bacterium]